MNGDEGTEVRDDRLIRWEDGQRIDPERPRPPSQECGLDSAADRKLLEYPAGEEPDVCFRSVIPLEVKAGKPVRPRQVQARQDEAGRAPPRWEWRWQTRTRANTWI